MPLAAVADVTLSAGATEIGRYDRQFQTTVSANLADGALLGPVSAAGDAVAGTDRHCPPAHAIQPSGDAEIMGEVFGAFGIAMGAGMMLVYVVLVLLFHNFITPVTILMSLPLAIGGAILALFITGNSISMAVVIGFLMLMGIVTKNSIMLVEFALTSMERRHAQARGDPGCGPQARAPDRDDHHRDERGNDPLGAGDRRGRRIPRAHGDRGDRGIAAVHGPVAAVRAVAVLRRSTAPSAASFLVG